MQNIVNLSGGKDSTAMLLLMIEKKVRIDKIINIDMGFEFPATQQHLEDLQKYISPLKIESYKVDFEYYLTRAPVETKRGKIVFGMGWPRWNCRWCTGRKIALVRHVTRNGMPPNPKTFYKHHPPHALHYIGIAAGEKRPLLGHQRHPLVEWGITQETALKICYERGFLFGGHYEHFERASCFCCPFNSNMALYTIYMNHPELWAEIRRLDEVSPNSFHRHRTVAALELIFSGGRRIKGLDKYRIYA